MAFTAADADVFLDSFDHYDDKAEIGMKWTSYDSFYNTISSTTAFSSGQSIYNARLHKGVTPIAQVVGGARLNFDFDTMNAHYMLVGTVDSSTDTTTSQLNIRVLPSGHIAAYRANTLLGQTTQPLIQAGVWNYIEWGFSIATGATGIVVVRVNEQTVLSLTSQTTATAATIDIVEHGQSVATGASVFQYIEGYIDDYYLLPGSGAASAGDFTTAMWGDVRMGFIVPEGAGNETDFTPSAGANWECVDDILANQDTNYVQSGTAGHQDDYTFQDITPTPTSIKAVQLSIQEKAIQATGRVSRQRWLIGSDALPSTLVEYETDDYGVPTSYQFHRVVRQNNPNPDGSTAWTKAIIDAAQWGLKVQT